MVRVRVLAAALNHLDIFVLGGLPGVTITPPWVMGADATGIVDALGTTVPDSRAATDAASASKMMVGDRVVVNPGLSDRTCQFCRAGEQSLCVSFRLLGEHAPGTFAEYAVVPLVNVRKIPDSIPVEAAAGFTLATLTAWRMLHTRARLTRDDTVLIWGIGGGVALAALQIALQVGAEVWVTSGSDDKLEMAKALGARHTINHRNADVGREIRAATGKRGVSVVVDTVGSATWGQSLSALGRAGRLVTCGASSGPMDETDVRRLFWNQWNIMGSTMGNDLEFDAVTAELSAGRLLPPVDSIFPLGQGRDAFARLKSGSQFGKVVLKI